LTRVVIVNADDFGLSQGINQGIVLAHERGIVTSTSAMVRWPAAEEAADLAGAHPKLDVGLHVDLSESVYRDGEWTPLYQVVSSDRVAVEAEVAAQLARFISLFGRQPTHLDSHQHVHVKEPIRSVLVETGLRLEVPVRNCTPGIVYRGDFYGQTARGEPLPEAITLEALLGLLSTLPAGITEIGCHPAAEPEVGSTYATERPEELRVLCDPRVKEAFEAQGIQLRSFADLPRRG
jgi:chitin disaccharide deacetylase